MRESSDDPVRHVFTTLKRLTVTLADFVLFGLSFFFGFFARNNSGNLLKPSREEKRRDMKTVGFFSLVLTMSFAGSHTKCLTTWIRILEGGILKALD